jgi:D-xylose transport system permease protein
MTVGAEKSAEVEDGSFAADTRHETTLRDEANHYLNRLRGGDMGSLPAILGLVVLYIVFGLANERFLSMLNQANLIIQAGSICVLAMGLVFVLLLGEIDLSVGSVSGFTAAIMAVLNVKSGWAPVPAMGVAILAGLGIGALQGFWVTKLRVPSFVVTLAGLLAWQGALLYVLGSTGTVNITSSTITGLTSTFFGPVASWAIAGAAIAAYVATVAIDRARRRAAGLRTTSLQVVGARVVALVVVVVAATAMFGRDRGVPLATLILVGFVVAFDVMTRRTRFGRHIFAVGGNEEAARRAGISVDGVRIVVFTLCSGMAAIGGILAASRLLAVNQSSGANDLLLNAIAAAVIGGTSLFGGRGSAWSALLGALVIGSISNGMDLLNVQSSVKFMVTGAVLLVAVTVDALSRRGRASAGRF